MNAFLIFAILSVTLLVAHAQVSTKAGSCPSAEGLIGTCDEACSSDDSCPGTQKCCSNGCGHACVDVANSTTPVVKPGTCPPAGVAGLCFEGCSSDSVCENAKKCCSNGCGHTCQMPTECAGQTCRVNEVCDVKTNSCKCPGTVFNCFLDPCTNAKCDVVGAKCVSSYCGGCNVEFLMDDGTKANCGSTTDSCNDCAGQVRPMIADVLCSDGVNSAGYRCNKTSCKYEFQECPACNDCAGQMRPMIADVLCSDGVSISGYRCNKTSCKYQFQECPACNDCAGQMRPMIADVLCSDGVNSAGYRCNKTTCKYQFQDCPKTDCNDCAGQVRPMIADVKCSDGISVSGYRCNKDTCKYEFQDCPKPTTCNDCAGQMRPMIADITCSDGISVSGYRCNKVTCQYEFQKCPDASCDSCTVNTLIACPTSSAGNPCGKKVCQLVNGVCVGYLSCADCPVDTKPTCQVGGCNSELCYSSGVGPAPVSICALIAPLNPPCTRLTACQYNETAGNCMWLNNDAYLKCLSDPNHVPVDDCKSRTPCTCTSNPKCAYCKSTITLADGTTTSLGLCMSQDIAASKCLTPKASLGLGGNLLTAACDTPVKLAPIANSIDTVKESDVQTKINEILSGTTIATKFSIMLEHIVDAVQSGVDPTQDVVRLLTTLGGNGDPSAADKVTLCKVISDAIAAKIGTSKRVINCNFIKVDDKSVSVKRGISQTSSSTYMSETTFGNDNTNNNTANTATFPGYAIAIIIIVIIVVIAVVIAILLLRNGRKNEPMLDYH